LGIWVVEIVLAVAEVEAMEVAVLMETTEMAAMMMMLVIADQVAGRGGLFERLHLQNHSLREGRTRRPETVLHCNILH
jgi:hypothetical protein